MSSSTQDKSLSDKLLFETTRLVSKIWPIARYVFPETLEIDDNQALWVSQTPNYRPTLPQPTERH